MQEEEDNQEEAKNESPEEKRARFFKKWDQVIKQDVEEIQQNGPVQQRPLSRAYLSLCPANRASNKQV